MQTNRFVEILTLESRTLFSAVGHGHIHKVHAHVQAEVTPNPTAITADLQKLSNDFQQYLTDRAGWMSAYLADIAAVKADRAKLLTDTSALQTTLATDKSAAKAALDADKAAMYALYNSEQPQLALDKANIKLDIASNNTAQLAVDQQTYLTDHSAAEAAMQPLYQKYVADQASWKTTLFSDRQAIENGGGADHQQYVADLAKLRADAKTWGTTLKADRQAIAGDEKQLKLDGYVEPDGNFGGNNEN